MSKEQTPIEWIVEQIFTDVEIHDEYGEVERVEYWNAFRSCTDLSEYIKEAKQKEREYAQAKVLEALEREVIEAHTQGQAFVIKQDNIKHGRYPIASIGYYQTQVKPKYE